MKNRTMYIGIIASICTMILSLKLNHGKYNFILEYNLVLVVTTFVWIYLMLFSEKK